MSILGLKSKPTNSISQSLTTKPAKQKVAKTSKTKVVAVNVVTTPAKPITTKPKKRKSKRAKKVAKKEVKTVEKTTAPVKEKVSTKKEKAAPGGKRVKRGINLNSAIIEFINTEKRFVSSGELADKYCSFYPEKTRNEFAKYISVLLSIAKHAKKLGATSVDKNGNESRASYWGMPAWFEDGKGKKEFYK